METYIIRAGNGNQGAVTNRLQNEVASGKSVQETSGERQELSESSTHKLQFRVALPVIVVGSRIA
jgi:hypothetical protein